MTVSIADHFAGIEITSEKGDEYPIAGLAVFTQFDPSNAGRNDEPSWVIAHEVLVDAYEGCEMVGSTVDHHDGFTMTFTDGSAISYAAP